MKIVTTVATTNVAIINFLIAGEALFSVNIHNKINQIHRIIEETIDAIAYPGATFNSLLKILSKSSIILIFFAIVFFIFFLFFIITEIKKKE